jgi:hypothetical protein
MAGDSCGFYQQHKLVASVHFGAIAKQLHRPESSAPTAVSGGKSILGTSPARAKTTAQPSSRWSDIRILIDRISQKTAPDKHGAHASSAQPKSVSARSALKQQKLTALRMAQETVQFRKFARWIYTVLKCLAEEREKELEYQCALQRHLQMTTCKHNLTACITTSILQFRRCFSLTKVLLHCFPYRICKTRN